MSTHMVDEIIAVLLPKEHVGHYQDVFIILHESGSSNCFDASGPHSGKRSRGWWPAETGAEWEVIDRCCRTHAAGCAGRMVKLHGRDTTPETFIRAYRKALASPITIEQGRAAGFMVSGLVHLNRHEEPQEASAERLKQIQEAGHPIAQRCEQYPGSKPYNVAEFDLADPAQAKLWFKTRWTDSASLSVQVKAPWGMKRADIPTAIAAVA